MGLTVTGVDELTETLRQALPHAVTPDKMQRALVVAAEPMRARMAELAPRGDTPPHLADAMLISVDEQTGAVEVGPAWWAYYSFYIEFGTVYQSARPFARPAFDTGHQRALKTISGEVWTDVKAAIP